MYVHVCTVMYRYMYMYMYIVDVHVHVQCTCTATRCYTCTHAAVRVHGRYQHEVELVTVEKEDIMLEFPNLCLPDPDPAGEYTHTEWCTYMYRFLHVHAHIIL